MAWRGMPWRGRAWSADSRSSTSFSPHLISSRTHPSWGFPWGFPIVSPTYTISSKSHKHGHSPTISFNQSSSPSSPYSPSTTIWISSCKRFPHGVIPPLSTMPKSRSPSLPHFPSPRYPSSLSLWDQTPVLFSSPTFNLVPSPVP